MSKHIKAAAKGIAALGRGDDSVLIHMTPGEVAGLQKLALATGGSLTINPHTGLVEAGWLSSILPMVVGGVATVMSGGTLAPAMAALYGGLAGAAGAKLEGGDPLAGGLGGALGGFGGGSLAGGLMGAGKGVAGAAAASQGTAQSAAAQGAGVMQNAAPAAVAAPGAPSGAAMGSTMTDSAIRAGLQNTATATGKEQLMAGIQGLAKPEGWKALGANMTPMGKLGAVGATAQGIQSLDSGSDYPGKGKKPMYYHTWANIDPNGYTTYGPGYWDKKYNYETLGMNPPDDEKFAEVRKAEGGPVPSPKHTDNEEYMAYLQDLVRRPPPMPSPSSPSVNQPVVTAPPAGGKDKKSLFGRFFSQMQTRGNSPDPQNFSYDPNEGFTRMNSGGIAGLRKRDSKKGGKPRLLRGKGDGVSDSIPAKINGKQDAALADGEFVIPARHVSELGNGSTEAGARQLYAMMKRIEQKRAKSIDKFADDSKAREELPA